MVYSDPTEEDIQEQRIRDSVKLPISGKVTKVYRHGEDSDNNNIHVDVETFGKNSNTHEKVPWVTPSRGMVTLPHKGIQTLLIFLEGEGDEARAMGNIHTESTRSHLNREGDWRVRLGNAVVETRMVKGSSGGSGGSDGDSDSSGWNRGTRMPQGGRSDSAG